MITSTHSEDLAIWAFRARVWNYLEWPVRRTRIEIESGAACQSRGRREAVGRQIERPGAMLPQASSEQAPGRTEKAGDCNRSLITYAVDHHDAAQRLAARARVRHEPLQLQRLFRNSFGCSCREYVMRLRIETRLQDLEAPHPSVTQIAITGGIHGCVVILHACSVAHA